MAGGTTGTAELNPVSPVLPSLALREPAGYGEAMGVTADEREETRGVVFVHVNGVGLQSAKGSPYLGGIAESRGKLGS